MHQPREEWQLETNRLGQRVHVFDEIDSTNAHAARLADDRTLAGLVFLADVQHGGRGQHGRAWLAPPGSSVLLSVLLFPPTGLRRPVLLAAWAAVAVCSTIRAAVGREAVIKWPNDVLIDGRKVSGILIEQGRGTVAGVGLNVNQTAEMFSEADLPDACSLASCSGRSFDSYEIARELILALDHKYDALCRGDSQGLESRWREHTGLLDRDVMVETHAGNHAGRLREQSFEAIVIEPPAGGLLRFAPEFVRHVREFFPPS